MNRRAELPSHQNLGSLPWAVEGPPWRAWTYLQIQVQLSSVEPLALVTSVERRCSCTHSKPMSAKPKSECSIETLRPFRRLVEVAGNVDLYSVLW